MTAQMFRSALLAHDRASTQALLRAWKVIQADTLRDLEALTTRMQQAGIETPAQLAREQRYLSLLAQLEQRISGYATYVGQTVTVQQQAVVSLALEHSATQLAAGVSVSFNRLPVQSVEHLVGTLADGSPLSTLLDTFGKEARASVADTLISAVGRGLGPRRIAPTVRRALATTPVRALTLSRTSILSASRSASLQSYRANADILSGWRWLSAKSPRSCIACLTMDGKIFDLEKPMPAHVNCRCSCTPVIKGVEDTARETGADWFAKQDEATQQDLMGKAAHAAYKRGDVALSDFVGTHTDRRWGTSIRVRSLREVLAS